MGGITLHAAHWWGVVCSFAVWGEYIDSENPSMLHIYPYRPLQWSNPRNPGHHLVQVQGSVTQAGRRCYARRLCHQPHDGW